jgi:alkylhydroperoxidase family enzyme
MIHGARQRWPSAREVALTRGKVSDRALDAVRVAGFTDGQILDIVAVVVQFSMTNYFNNVMKTDIDVFPNKTAPSSR